MLWIGKQLFRLVEWIVRRKGVLSTEDLVALQDKRHAFMKKTMWINPVMYVYLGGDRDIHTLYRDTLILAKKRNLPSPFQMSDQLLRITAIVLLVSIQAMIMVFVIPTYLTIATAYVVLGSCYYFNYVLSFFIDTTGWGEEEKEDLHNHQLAPAM